jgi:hypothetical protein
MNTRLLFPHRYRLVGWLLFIPAFLLGLATMYYQFEWSFMDVALPEWAVAGAAALLHVEAGKDTVVVLNLTNELAALGAITGLLLIAFSKEIVEDEMISQLRLEALQWSVYINYSVLAVAVLLIHGLAFYEVTVYNMFTLLLVFIARFQLTLRRRNQLLAV